MTTPLHRPRINIIAALSSNGVIGRAGRLPWSIPADMRWLKNHTAGNPVVLGRVCYETWPSVHQEGRMPVVVTSRQLADLHPRGFSATELNPLLADTSTRALELAATLGKDIYVCGGSRLFAEVLPLCDRLLLTRIHSKVEGDVLFPPWEPLSWKTIYEHDAHDGGHDLTFTILERVAL